MPQAVEFRLLTVCSGNICRSPLARLLLRRGLVLAVPGRAFEVDSAGTIAFPGAVMPDEAVVTATRLQLLEADARAHRAARLTAEAIERADLVLAMSREHRAEIVGLVPAALRRTFTLREFARLLTDASLPSPAQLTAVELVAEASRIRSLRPRPQSEHDDIPDPYRQTQQLYDEVGDAVAAAVELVVAALAATVVAASRSDPGASATPFERPDGPDLSFRFPRL